MIGGSDSPRRSLPRPRSITFSSRRANRFGRRRRRQVFRRRLALRHRGVASSPGSSGAFEFGAVARAGEQLLEFLLRLAHRRERHALFQRQRAIEPCPQFVRQRPRLSRSTAFPSPRRAASQVLREIGLVDRAAENQRQRDHADLDDVGARVEDNLAGALRHRDAQLRQKRFREYPSLPSASPSP